MSRAIDHRARPCGVFLSMVVLLVGLVACDDRTAPPAPSSTPPPPTPITPTSITPASGHHEDADHEREHLENGHGEAEHEDVVVLTADAASRSAIRTAAATTRVLVAERSTTGQVDFDQSRLAHVSPRITGRVHRVHATLGQRVRAGQRLAELDSIELGQAQAAYLQAKARAELAEKSHQRAMDLYADRIVSEQETIEAEASQRETTASLRAAEASLHLYGLRQEDIDSLAYDDRGTSIYPLSAPFTGTVVERHATLGELVTPERNLFTLADLGRVWIWIDIDQRDLGSVHLDDLARARIDAFPGEIFEGKLTYLSARVDADTRTVRARIDVPNPDAKLRPGMFVEVDLFDPHVRENGKRESRQPAVPENAVVRDGDAFVLFVAQSDRRFARRVVEIGRQSGGWIEILDGVEAGEPVVVEGAFLLKSAFAESSLGGGHTH